MKSHSPRAWQRMLSGRRLDLIDPSAFDIEIEDIAYGLARLARWNGQTHGSHFFSVAQHSLLVEALTGHFHADLSPQQRLTALLHDGPEYVIGDMISPFKALLGETYHKVEEKLQCAIHQRWNLAYPTPSKLKKWIKQSDRAAAYHEAVRLAGFGSNEALRFFSKPQPLPQELEFWLDPMPIECVQTAFLNLFFQLDAAVNLVH